MEEDAANEGLKQAIGKRLKKPDADMDLRKKAGIFATPFFLCLRRAPPVRPKHLAPLAPGVSKCISPPALHASEFLEGIVSFHFYSPFSPFSSNWIQASTPLKHRESPFSSSASFTFYDAFRCTRIEKNPFLLRHLRRLYKNNILPTLFQNGRRKQKMQHIKLGSASDFKPCVRHYFFATLFGEGITVSLFSRRSAIPTQRGIFFSNEKLPFPFFRDPLLEKKEEELFLSSLIVGKLSK